MSIRFRCINGDCQRPLRVKDTLGGKRVKCPSCRCSQYVPEPEDELEPEERSPLEVNLGSLTSFSWSQCALIFGYTFLSLFMLGQRGVPKSLKFALMPILGLSALVGVLIGISAFQLGRRSNVGFWCLFLAGVAFLDAIARVGAVTVGLVQGFASVASLIGLLLDVGLLIVSLQVYVKLPGRSSKQAPLGTRPGMAATLAILIVFPLVAVGQLLLMQSLADPDRKSVTRTDAALPKEALETDRSPSDGPPDANSIAFDVYVPRLEYAQRTAFWQRIPGDPTSEGPVYSFRGSQRTGSLALLLKVVSTGQKPNTGEGLRALPKVELEGQALVLRAIGQFGAKLPPRGGMKAISAQGMLGFSSSGKALPKGTVEYEMYVFSIDERQADALDGGASVRVSGVRDLAPFSKGLTRR